VVVELFASAVTSACRRTGAGPHGTDQDQPRRETMRDSTGLTSPPQYSCLAVYEHDWLVVVDDLEAEHRWPECRDRALEFGFQSVFAVRPWGQIIG
jgi:hypothetical protein